MKLPGLFIYLLSTTATASVSTQCSNNDSQRCLCIYSREYEYQCRNVIIHAVPEQYFHLDCESDTNLEFPDYKSGNTTNVRIRFCPVPQNSFSRLLELFDINIVKQLYLFNTTTQENSISKNAFYGLVGVEELTISYFEKKIDCDLLEYFPKLTQFYLENSQFGNCENFYFPSSLKVLHLIQSKLIDVPEFESVEELLELQLSGNLLHTIKMDNFINITFLESLDLSSNSLITIDEGSFSSLKNLRVINLSFNNLRFLNKTIFKCNKKLEVIKLSNNPYLEIKENIFSSLSGLLNVDLNSCMINYLPENLFSDTKNIQEIYLKENKIKTVFHAFFEGLTELKSLDLSGNLIKIVPDNIFIDLINLETLKLDDNNLSTISESLFQNNINLIHLSLRNNKIKDINIEAFQTLQKLTFIDISNNLYRHNYYYEASPFLGCEALESIILKNNLIELFPSVLTTMQGLKRIDLSANRIENIQVVDIVSDQLQIIDLKDNHIQDVDFQGVEVIIRDNLRNSGGAIETTDRIILDLRENPIPCNCQNYQFIRYLQNQLDPIVKSKIEVIVGESVCLDSNKTLMEVQPEEVTCSILGINCPKECNCAWRPFTKFVEINCARRNLTYYPIIEINETKVLVDLEGNCIVSGPAPELGYENVQSLILSNNRIQELEWIPKSIEVLKLDGNSLHKLNVGIFNESNLTLLELGHNSWDCDCSSVDLQNFLKSHYKQVNPNEVICSEDRKPLVDKKDLCKYSLTIKMTFIFSTILLILIVLFLVLYIHYRTNIKIWLYSKNMCLWFVTEEELDEDKIYDIFISFARQDEKFVTENLLPVLESGPESFKICIHFRDWIAGSSILSNISYSVLNSKRTLVVLSNNFLDSVWSKKEFCMAHSEAIKEGRARLIVIKYGELDVNKLDDELKAYVDTNTYVEWGKPWFWNRLKYALPHSRKKTLYV